MEHTDSSMDHEAALTENSMEDTEKTTTPIDPEIERLLQVASDRPHKDADIRFGNRSGKYYWYLEGIGFLYFVGETKTLAKWQIIKLNQKLKDYDELCKLHFVGK